MKTLLQCLGIDLFLRFCKYIIRYYHLYLIFWERENRIIERDLTDPQLANFSFFWDPKKTSGQFGILIHTTKRQELPSQFSGIVEDHLRCKREENF